MKMQNPVKLALFYALPFVVVVTAVFLFLLFRERQNLAEEQQEGLTRTARTLLQQIIVTRLWNAGHGGLWLSIIVFILLVSSTLSRRVVGEMTRELELSRLTTALAMAGAAAHEIRQPLTVLSAFFGMLRKKAARDPEHAGEIDDMSEQCRRINDIIVRMKSMTVYRTRAYAGDRTIADLGRE